MLLGVLIQYALWLLPYLSPVSYTHLIIFYFIVINAELCTSASVCISFFITHPLSLIHISLSEATAPVKLPAWHCPTAGLRRLVRSPISQGWYPNSGSAATDVTVSQPPTYPVHATPDPSAKLE